jgi:CelD/BcsL family acetyltransferase involved in cellulose biosynthesis
MATGGDSSSTGCARSSGVYEWRDFATGSLRQAWDELPHVASEPNPFMESWYLLPSLENFDPAGESRIFASFAGGRLVGLLPVGRDTRYSGRPIPHLGNWMHPNMFCSAPLVAAGQEEHFWRGLIDWADAHCRNALFLHLTHLPADGPLFEALRKLVSQQGRSAAIVMAKERALLRSELSPEDYFDASMSGKKRKELRRQAKRLGEEGELVFTRQEDGAGLDRWIDEFFELEARGWKGEQGSALACDPRTAALFSNALAGAVQHGRLERLALHLDGKPIAMLVNFLTPPGAYSFKTAFDNAYSRYSPGVLIQRENLDLLGRENIEWCDSCAAADHPMIERIWREKRRIVRVSIAIGGNVRRMIFRQLARIETGTPAQGL